MNKKFMTVHIIFFPTIEKFDRPLEASIIASLGDEAPPGIGICGTLTSLIVFLGDEAYRILSFVFSLIWA